MKSPFFHQCIVMDNKDPLMLGRVRGKRIDDDYSAVINSIKSPDWNEEKDKWTERDPFIFNPLLPYFLYQVPKENELILILYYNEDFQYLNQFYVQSLFSTPTITNQEYFIGGQKWSGLGINYKPPVPIKNRDGIISSPFPIGVFPEPGDNALMGRNSADIIVKENDVLLRAGKIVGDLQPNVLPKGYNRRAFLQLSRFDNINFKEKDVEIRKIVEEVVLVNYLIEYDIFNPTTTDDKFNGKVYLWRLKQDSRVNSENLGVNSLIDDLKTLVYSENFRNLSLYDSVRFINKFIKNCNDKDTLEGVSVFPKNQIKFPIFFRPTNEFYTEMLNIASDTTISVNNLETIYGLIKLNYSSFNTGYGLIYAKDKVGKPYSIKKEIQEIYKNTNYPTTVALLNADKLYIMSNLSAVPGKKNINLDNTLYGVNSEEVSQRIDPNTSSMVRGEELLQLLSKIVSFLLTHTHAYPGLPPVEVTENGSDAQDLWNELSAAYTKVLNKNIRLN